VRGIFYGTTKTMETKWTALLKLKNEEFLNIIVGDLPLSAFDDFVKEWKVAGGEHITLEVSRIVHGKQRRKQALMLGVHSFVRN